MNDQQDTHEHCIGCVYYPPNLPPGAYPVEDYRMLQEKDCSFDYSPGDADCAATRKTSCSLVDLEQVRQAGHRQETTS